MMLENILVVKFGGGAGLDVEACARDLAEIARCRPVVVVHGVSATLDALCAERGVPVRTLTSPSGHASRYTNAETRDLFVVSARSVGEQWAAALGRYGIAAQAVEPCVTGTRKDAVRAVIDGRVRIVRDDYTGVIGDVDTGPLRGLLGRGIVPVVPPLATSADGPLNIDGDRAAAAIASALDAAELVILSNVRGLYRDYADAGSLVSQVVQRDLPRAIDWAAGRMKRKVLGAQEALDGGVGRVVIGDGRVHGAVSAALHGAGTEFVR
jgi:[amino group carrier protein]-L-2-aminoadipate 6-kinase